MENKYDVKCSVILGICGDYWRVAAQVARTLGTLKELPYGYELIICYDEPWWGSTPLLQVQEFSSTKMIQSTEPFGSFGHLFNQALKQANGKLCTFIWPGVELNISILNDLCDVLGGSEQLSCIYSKINKPSSTKLDPPTIHFGLLQCHNFIRLHGSVFKKDALLSLEGFSENDVFQGCPEWDLFIRLSKFNEMKYQPRNVSTTQWELEEYPFLKVSAHSNNSIRQSLMSCRSMVQDEKGHHISVLVTGGYWEHVHNQLCFFNYFEMEGANEKFKWKTMFDFEVSFEDIADVDMVIISRGRHKNVLKILKHCKARNIPTIYMIDDNWITVGEDWPQYKSTFSPGLPEFETFLECLRQSSVVLVYSEVLETYIKEYSNEIIKMDVNINLRHFEATSPKIGKPIIGYAGSPRVTEAPFIGLKSFLEENTEWNLLIFGTETPTPLNSLQADRIIQCRYVNYHRYARDIATIKPDILLAPLDNTTFSKSKCPNKFLEISACGAAGIYSDITPYSDVVINKQNGILVPEEYNNDWKYWLKAIESLAQDRLQRENITRNALKTLRARFDTSVHYSEFCSLIESVLAKFHRPQ